jgi:hypothetical protein
MLLVFLLRKVLSWCFGFDASGALARVSVFASALAKSFPVVLA